MSKHKRKSFENLSAAARLRLKQSVAKLMKEITDSKGRRPLRAICSTRFDVNNYGARGAYMH